MDAKLARLMNSLINFEFIQQEAIVKKEPLLDQEGFFVVVDTTIQRDGSGRKIHLQRYTNVDGYYMFSVEPSLKIIQYYGSHPYIDGALRFASYRKLIERIPLAKHEVDFINFFSPTFNRISNA